MLLTAVFFVFHHLVERTAAPETGRFTAQALAWELVMHAQEGFLGIPNQKRQKFPSKHEVLCSSSLQLAEPPPPPPVAGLTTRVPSSMVAVHDANRLNGVGM